MAKARPNKRTAGFSSNKRHKKQKLDSIETPRDVKPLRDPIQYLNMDVINLIFDSLDTESLSTCEKVSKTWRCAAQDWMELYRGPMASKLRPGFPVSIPSSVFSNAEIKHYASHLDRMRAGNATSFNTRAEKTDILGGGFGVFEVAAEKGRKEPPVTKIVWRAEQSPRYSDGTIDRDYELYKLSPGHTGIECDPRGKIYGQDGILALRFLQLSGWNGSVVPKVIVYSVPERKVLWEISSDTTPLTAEQIVPLEIGKTMLYCGIRRSEDNYDFAAFNYRTGKLVYVFPGNGPDWILDDIYRNDYAPRAKAFQAGNDELVLFSTERQTRAVPAPSDRLQIMRGSDGEILHSFHFCGQESWRTSPLFDPLTHQVAIIWDLTSESPALYNITGIPELEHYSATVVRTFSYKDGTASALSEAMVVFHAALLWQCEALQPFTMTALGYDVTSKIDCRVEWRVTRRNLVPEEHPFAKEEAQAVVDALFPKESVGMRGCFRVDRPKLVRTRPPVSKRTGNKVTVYAGADMEWANDRRLLIDAEGRHMYGQGRFWRKGNWVVDF